MTPRRDRTTLEARLASGPLAPAEAAALAADLASALAGLHRRGDAHGAVRPDAIVLAGGRAALATAFPSSAPEPGDVGALRRAAYAAPEVLRGRRLGPAADLFGLGVVLHEALGGAHPFRVDEDLETVRRILHEPAPPLAEPGVPRALAELVGALLAKAPRHRPTARKV
ncbi:MAG TPA: protein kinase, partial [Anaeromyxobacteraceae bacterium]|nr:protein kinase [Anaeromyxobacteraceae bacterium]